MYLFVNSIGNQMKKSLFIFRNACLGLLSYRCFSQVVFAQNSNNQTTQNNKSAQTLPPYTAIPQNRIGLSFGGTLWSLGALIDYDRRELFPDFHWTLGVEIGVYDVDLAIEPRALWWENKNMSGFYVGPKLYFVTGDYYDRYHDYQTFFGVGAEGGWAYRFPENFDLGAGIEASLTTEGPWLAIKISAGYLL